MAYGNTRKVERPKYRSSPPAQLSETVLRKFKRLDQSKEHTIPFHITNFGRN